ncbi:MAG: ATP-binding cassette domain-containing protein [Rhodospirillaceae bacterium]|nr:ATP-binding cassette domain-containing protein [Rhodospirillaceae bacterium]
MPTETETNAPRSKPKRFTRPLIRVAFERADVMLASFAINLLSLALPLVILQVYDRIIPNESTETFLFLCLGLVVVIFIDGFLRSLRSQIITWAAARFEHAVSTRAVRALLGAEIVSFERSPAGTHMDRIGAVEMLRDFHSGQGLVNVTDLPFAVVFLALIYLIGGDLVWAPLAVVGIAAVFAIVLGIRLDRAVRRRNDLDDKRHNFVFQVLNGIHSVKGLGMEAQMSRRYQSFHAPLAAAVRDTNYLSSLGQSVGAVLGSMAMVSVAAAGSIMVIDDEISGGSLIACMLLAGRAIQPLIRMVSFWVQTRNLNLAQERLDFINQMDQEKAGGDLSDLPDFSGQIELDNVTVYRGDPDVPVLSNVNLTINAGEIVAVTGKSGGGKAAFLELFAGLLQPGEGTMLYDGTDTRNIDFRKLRKRIGYVRQFAVLFRGTLVDNMTMFEGADHLAAALETGHSLGLDETIAKMPKGMKTRAGDTASEGLAGSIQQVIALVRALSRKPVLLLFDEANSALDFDADKKLQDLIEKKRGQMTMVMVTDRPSMIAQADRVLDINKSQVHEINTATTDVGGAQ